LVIKKSKAKQWFSVIAPKLFNEMELAKTMAVDPESLIDRKIGLSVMELTNDFSKYYMKIFFRIKKVEGDKAFAEFAGSECMRDYISRMVLRRARRIDTVQDLVTKDGKKITVKGITISRRIKSNIEKAIRVRMKVLIKSEVENSTLDEFIKKILTDEMKGLLLRECRRIYPVRNFEVRKTSINV